jgi:hypothetical protein
MGWVHCIASRTLGDVGGVTGVIAGKKRPLAMLLFKSQ